MQSHSNFQISAFHLVVMLPLLAEALIAPRIWALQRQFSADQCFSFNSRLASVGFHVKNPTVPLGIDIARLEITARRASVSPSQGKEPEPDHYALLRVPRDAPAARIKQVPHSNNTPNLHH